MRREAFTPEQLQQAWLSYIDQNPHEKLVVSSMRGARLQPADNAIVNVLVEGQAQLESIDSVKSKLISHLRDAVNNDMLALELKVAPTEGGEDLRILTPREVVEDIKQRRPEFIPFIETFQLGLA